MRPEVVRSASADPRVTVRFWAGARAAAGVESTDVSATDVGGLRARLLAWCPELAPVLEVSSLLVDGVTATTDTTTLPDGAVVEVLPPFAGG